MPLSSKAIEHFETAQLLFQQARELSRKFVDAFDARTGADYDRTPTVGDSAMRILGYAQEILDFIQQEMNK